jgi:hypothetical protein
LFLGRNGENYATDYIDLGSYKLINIGIPSNDNDGVNKRYVDNRIPLPSKKLLAPFVTDLVN